MRLLAIDPGSEHSGFVEYDPVAHAIREHGIAANAELLARCWRDRDPGEPHHLAIEMINVFGMAGATVFETCVWIGRFVEAWGAKDYTKVTRHEVKLHLCHTSKSDDSSVRAALIARWGGEAAIGGKGRGKAKTPRGPLHGIASHAWSALAVAVTWSDLHPTTPASDGHESAPDLVAVIPEPVAPMRPESVAAARQRLVPSSPLSMRQTIATVLASLINRGSFHGSWITDRLSFGDGNAFAEKALTRAAAAGWITRGNYDPTVMQCSIGIGGMPGRDVARCDEEHRSAVAYHWITAATKVLEPADVEAQVWP